MLWNYIGLIVPIAMMAPMMTFVQTISIFVIRVVKFILRGSFNRIMRIEINIIMQT